MELDSICDHHGLFGGPSALKKALLFVGSQVDFTIYSHKWVFKIFIELFICLCQGLWIKFINKDLLG